MVLQTFLPLRQASRAVAGRSVYRTIPPALSAPQLLSERCFSSGVDKHDGTKPLTTFQKLQKWMQPFVTGSKALVAENKQAWAIRRRLKQASASASSASSTPPPQLTRQEMMILRQAHRDLAKSLPLLLFFAVPLAGYAAPLVGYQFPKQLLPWQFWRPDQKTQFFQEDAAARAKFYPELVQLLEQIDRKDDALRELLATQNGCLHPAQLSELVPFFDPAADGPAGLPRLTRHHVQVLARSIALVPAFSWVWEWLPRNTVERFLLRRMDELRVDDAMLLTEGIDQLSLSELEFACEERGIVDGYGDIEALRNGLRDWLSMYDVEKGAALPANFPASLLLHAPALMNPTGENAL